MTFHQCVQTRSQTFWTGDDQWPRSFADELSIKDESGQATEMVYVQMRQ